MKHVVVTLFISTLALTGCVQMVNTADSEYHIEACVAAEKTARLLDVEAICTRTIMNVDWSKQKPALKSERFYNLGRIKRGLYKFSEAVFLFKESLAVEESILNPSELRIGSRLVELSISLAGQERWGEGAHYLERALPIIPQFTGEEREFAAKVLVTYGTHFRKLYQINAAEQFENAAAALY
ncbi:MAG: hypothetical protein OEV35_08155 [Gallionellaceae bacterium]|nr:hypothetical protein [Gallionellaceae bacterium]